MHLQRTSCILCTQNISNIKYNLKTTYSETSNVLLIKFVEKLYKNIFLMHCNICSQCYELLNELDNIQAREKALYTKLKNYISKIQDFPLKAKRQKKNEDLLEDIPVFSELSNDDVEPPVYKSDDAILDDINLDIDLKKLPIKVKKITSTKPLRKDNSSVTVMDSKSNPNQVSENQEAFEKIQSSIQMDLSKHVQEHLNKYKPTKDVLCEICGQNFKTKMGFENHMKKHGDAQDDLKILVMNKKDDDWSCNICGKIFTQKMALTRHIFIHTGETRYQCEECGKKFVHHSSFNMHRKIHAGERNYKCLECDKGFLTRSHLQRHLRAAHSGKKDHTCEICEKQFAENYNLIAHMKVVHKGHIDFAGKLKEEVDSEVALYYNI